MRGRTRVASGTVLGILALGQGFAAWASSQDGSVSAYLWISAAVCAVLAVAIFVWNRFALKPSGIAPELRLSGVWGGFTPLSLVEATHIRDRETGEMTFKGKTEASIGTEVLVVGVEVSTGDQAVPIASVMVTFTDEDGNVLVEERPARWTENAQLKDVDWSDPKAVGELNQRTLTRNTTHKVDLAIQYPDLAVFAAPNEIWATPRSSKLALTPPCQARLVFYDQDHKVLLRAWLVIMFCPPDEKGFTLDAPEPLSPHQLDPGTKWGSRRRPVG